MDPFTDYQRIVHRTSDFLATEIYNSEKRKSEYLRIANFELEEVVSRELAILKRIERQYANFINEETYN